MGKDVERLFEGRYPSFIALTGSCAKPLPSVRLRFPSYVRSLQVAASPCCAVVLPDVISANLSPRAWTPTPVASKVHTLVSSLGALAFPRKPVGRRRTHSQQLFQLGMRFRGCSHSIMFRPMSLLTSPIAPTLATLCSASLGGRGFYDHAYHGWLPSPCSGYAS